jgi:DNA-binding response OmpR family regulator
MRILEENGYISLREVSLVALLEYDGLVIDTKKRNIERDGKNINLTQYEFDVLYLLASSPGQVFSKAQIYNQVWKTPYYGAEDNVMSLIRRIRKKIEPDPAKPIYIVTVWGVGYKFNEATKRK